MAVFPGITKRHKDLYQACQRDCGLPLDGTVDRRATPARVHRNRGEEDKQVGVTVSGAPSCLVQGTDSCAGRAYAMAATSPGANSRLDMCESARTGPGRRLGRGGFTVVELAVSLATSGVLLAMAYGGFRQYAEAATTRKASVQLAADVGLTRSFAIQRRENVSLVADEANRTYVIRDTAGTVLMQRSFGAGSDMPLTSVAVSTVGDSLTFNSRGLLVPSSAQVVLGRRGRSHTVRINALGRTVIN